MAYQEDEYKYDSSDESFSTIKRRLQSADHSSLEIIDCNLIKKWGIEYVDEYSARIIKLVREDTDKKIFFVKYSLRQIFLYLFAQRQFEYAAHLSIILERHKILMSDIFYKSPYDMKDEKKHGQFLEEIRKLKE